MPHSSPLSPGMPLHDPADGGVVKAEEITDLRERVAVLAVGFAYGGVTLHLVTPGPAAEE